MRSGGYTGRLCCHSAGHGQAGELGREEPDEVQQGQGQGPAPGEEQPQHQYRLGLSCWGAALWRGTWECWGTTG